MSSPILMDASEGVIGGDLDRFATDVLFGGYKIWLNGFPMSTRTQPPSVMFRLTTPFVLATLSISALAHKAYNPLMGRTEHPPQIPLACSLPQDAKCKCPTDLTGDVHGVMINVYPGYQCAYSGGACTWNDKTGELQNTGQTNCPNPGPSCGRFGCHCPLDNNKDFGVMINQFTGYQCAYGNGACTWDFDGVLQNIYQTNCPQRAPCVPA